MPGRVNTRFVILLASLLVLLVGAAVVVYVLVVRQDPQQQVMRGDEFAEAGEWSRATDYYGRALRSRRDDADLMLKYTDSVSRLKTADALTARKYIEQMLAWWGRATEADPRNPEPINKLMGLYLRLGQELGDQNAWDRMLERSEATLNVAPDSVAARKYRGIAQVNRMRSIDMDDNLRRRAREDLLLALEADPNDAEALYHLALWNLLQAKRLSTGNLADPKLAQSLREDAVARLARAVEANPQDPRRKMDLVTVLLEPEINAVETARPLVDELEKQLTDNPWPPARVLALADLVARLDRTTDGEGPTRGLQRAVTLLAAATEKHPQDIRYQVAYGRALNMVGEDDKALAVFDRARQLEGTADAVDALRSNELRLAASIQYADLLLTSATNSPDGKQREEVFDKVDQIVRFLRAQAGESAPVNLLAGKLDLARGDTGQALNRLTTASSQFRDTNPEALLLSARAAMQLREWGAAGSQLEKLVQLRPELASAKVELTRLYLQLRQDEKAATLVRDVLQREPENHDAQMLAAAIQAQAGNVDTAIAALEAMGAANDPKRMLDLAQLYMVKGDAEKARQLVQAAFDADPKNLNALQTLIRLTGDKAQAKALIQKSREAGGDERSLAFLEGQLEGTVDVAKFVDEEIEKIPDPLRRHLARYGLLMRMGKGDEAAKELAEAAKLEPDNPAVIGAQFDVALQKQDWAEAQKLAARASKLSLDLAEGAFFYGRLEMARGRFDEAINSFRQGLTLRRTYSEGHRLLGDAMRAKGDYSGAAEAYRLALDQKPDNVAAWRGAAAAFDAMRSYNEALDRLRRAIQFAPNDRQLVEQYLAYEQAYGDANRALELRRRMAAANPGDTDNRRTVALMQAQQGDLEGARKAVEDVIAQEGMNRSNAAVLAAVQRAGNDVDAAHKTIRDYIATRGDAADMEDYLVLGRFLLSVGRNDEALAAYRLATEREDKATRPATRELADLYFDRGATDESAALYKELYDSQRDDPRVALRYAEALLRSGNSAGAESVLKEAEAQFGESVETLLLRSLILAGQGKKAEVIAALDKAEQLDPKRAVVYLQRAQVRSEDPAAEPQVDADLARALELDPSLVTARLLRAQLLRQRDDLSGAATELRSLLAASPQLIQARLALVDLYLATNDNRSLQQLLEESARMFPEESAWPRIKAQVAERQGRVADALTLHQRAFEMQPSPQNLGNLALALLKAGKAADAVKLLQDNAAVVGSAPRLLAVRGRALHAAGDTAGAEQSFRLGLERAADLGQALAVASELEQATGPQASAELVTSVLSGSHPAWAALARAQSAVARQQWEQSAAILGAMRQPPAAETSEQLLYLQLLALTLYQQGRYDQALVAYEQLDKAQPNNLGTLNNLAYLLVENLGQAEKGLQLAVRAARLAPDNAQVLDTLGWAQFKAGQLDRALSTLRRSVRLTELPPNQYHLGVVLKELGDLRGAREAFNRSAVLAEQVKDASVLESARKALADLGQ